jgi:hypothetical protein
MPRMAPCGSRCVDRHLAYVGMTRHRTAVTLYAGQDEFRDLAALSDRLSRSNAKETPLDYAERRGLAPHSGIVLSEADRPAPLTAERGGRRQPRVLPWIRCGRRFRPRGSPSSRMCRLSLVMAQPETHCATNCAAWTA